MSSGPFLRRLTIWNYKSIALAQLDLESLAFLVGPNGSGKSNCLDALRFVADALRTSLDHALRDRGTIKEVRRRSGGHPTHFALRLDFQLPDGGAGHYAFRIGARPSGGYEVQKEELRVLGGAGGLGEHFYHVERGHIVATSMKASPVSLPDRLFLVAASGQPEFRAAFDALSRMEVYNLNPAKISAMQSPDPGQLLRRDGTNAASMLDKLDKPARKQISEYLAQIVPGVSQPETRILGSLETIEFRQIVKGQKTPWRFYSSSMSDGTLRALGVLLALFQNQGKSDCPPIIGLEEPETALHPAAAAVLLSALREASRHTQVLVTSHSPDLLDNPDIPTEAILAVASEEGITRIAPIDSAGREMLRNRLFTVGELLRQNQIALDPGHLADAAAEHQLRLFEHDGA